MKVNQKMFFLGLYKIGLLLSTPLTGFVQTRHNFCFHCDVELEGEDLKRGESGEARCPYHRERFCIKKDRAKQCKQKLKRLLMVRRLLTDTKGDF